MYMPNFRLAAPINLNTHLDFTLPNRAQANLTLSTTQPVPLVIGV